MLNNSNYIKMAQVCAANFLRNRNETKKIFRKTKPDRGLLGTFFVTKILRYERFKQYVFLNYKKYFKTVNLTTTCEICYYLLTTKHFLVFLTPLAKFS